MPAATRQLALQFAAVLLVLSLAWPYYGMKAELLPWGWVSLTIGAAAWLMATLSRQPWWWRLIHAIFLPLVWATFQLAIDPGWFLLAFMALLLVYRGAATGQIPLYFSNRSTAEALATLARERESKRVLDLGAGIGSLQGPLAKALPQTQVDGLEYAPLTWALGRLRLSGRPNARIHYGDLWQTDLGGHDLIYAFLSPEPMDLLGQKAAAEMAPGALLVSNSFPIPWAEADQIIDVADRRRSRLYCYSRVGLVRQLGSVAAPAPGVENPL